MIIGGSKVNVIKNIKQAILDGELNRKVEENDAILSPEQELEAIEKFYDLRQKKSFTLKHAAMQKMADAQLLAYDSLITFDGLEKLELLKQRGVDNAGFIITSNHFNPLDNLNIKKLVKKVYDDDVYIVVQATNLMASGVIGELFNYLNHIPVCKSASYIRGEFLERMREVIGQGHPILIYPEEEMWFNYRKPRPNKRGAFYFAAELNVPIVPCFVEILDTDKPDNDEFYESKYVVHVLDPIFPDQKESVRKNSIEMMAKDYEEKKVAYEKAYGKKLDYEFADGDVANLRKN